MPALYASTSILTAVREANQVGDLQPTTLVAYRAEIEAVFDATDAASLAAVGFDKADLADPTWRDQMKLSGEAPTQRLGRELAAQGYNGLLVPSFAKAAVFGDRNVILWKWSATAPSRLELIDDEHRLV
jgi:RES domain-containing protein